MPRGNDPEVVVHLAGLVSENEGDDGLAGHANVLEGTEDMNAGAGEDDSGFCGCFHLVSTSALSLQSSQDGEPTILNRKLGLSVLACNTTNRTSQSIGAEGLTNILDIEGLNIERIETEQGNGIVNVEAHGEGGDEIGTHLQGFGSGGVSAGAELDALLLDVHADLELAVLYKWGVADWKTVSLPCPNIRTCFRGFRLTSWSNWP